MEFAQKLLSTRRGNAALAAIAALLAFASLVVYLKRYRESLQSASQPVTVLVAKSLIERGTPGSVIGAQDLFQTSSIPRGQVVDGAITDPASLRGRISSKDIYPGQQLTAADFTTTDADTLGTELSGTERAISVPFDSAHGMLGMVHAGDRVDVLAGFNVRKLNSDGTPAQGASERPVVKVILQDALVLDAPSDSGGSGLGGGGSSRVTVRATEEQAANIAFAADNGKVWVVLRPRAGAAPVTPKLVTLETILFGARPVSVLRSFGAGR